MVSMLFCTDNSGNVIFTFFNISVFNDAIVEPIEAWLICFFT